MKKLIFAAILASGVLAAAASPSWPTSGTHHPGSVVTVQSWPFPAS